MHPLRKLLRPEVAGLAILAAQIQAARADVTVPALFTDRMVLQRELNDRVWGKADPGEEVTVKIAGQSKTAKAGGDGKWTVTLDPMAAGGPHILSIKGKNEVAIADVLVGEVWLCSGQSNMEWNVQGSNDSDLETLTATDPGIRFLHVPKVGTQEPQDDFKGKWEVCSPERVRSFSGVGYFFGRQLRQTLGVPIGLIDDSWGGSACEAWVRRDVLAADPAFRPLLDRWAEMEANLPKDQEAYKKALERWNGEAEKARAEGRPAPRRPQNPAEMMTGNARPGNLYNGVLRPLVGYGIRGAIWYQGETNVGRAYQYRALFPAMIKNWRDDWGIGDFSFYWAQLADHQAEKPEPGESAWAELREAQTMTMAKLPKTGEAVIIDLGEAQDIHPRNKQDVGRRLARWALAKDYKIPVACQSPAYKSMEKQGRKVVLTFDHVAGALKAFDVKEPLGFAVAGEDRKFHPARAKIVGDKVEVESDAVSDPVAVRYAWADNPVCNVYSRDGLPVTPFRTDDWPGVTANKN